MAAIASEYDFTADQGATFGTVLTWKDGNGTAINLTGYTARMQVRADYDATEKVLELTTANGRITLGGAAGTITLNVAASVMGAVNYGKYVYDIEVISGSGEVTRLLMGNFTIRPEVTK